LLPRLEAPVAASWVVDRVALVESQLHPAGARYTTVHEQMLG
jgi:2'-5' RNA ligase